MIRKKWKKKKKYSEIGLNGAMEYCWIQGAEGINFSVKSAKKRRKKRKKKKKKEKKMKKKEKKEW